MDIQSLTLIAKSLVEGESTLASFATLSTLVLAGLENEGFTSARRTPRFETEDDGLSKAASLTWIFQDRAATEEFLLNVGMATSGLGLEWKLMLQVSTAANGVSESTQIVASRLGLSARESPLGDDLQFMYASHGGKRSIGIIGLDDYSVATVDDGADSFQHFLRQFEANLTAELAC